MRVAALVFKSKEPALPDIGPAVAAAVLLGSALEAKRLAGGVGLGGRRVVEDMAQVKKVLLRGGTLLQLHLAPFGDESGYGHSADSVAA